MIENFSLKDCRVVLLRTLAQAQELNKELSLLGADVILCPMIEIIPKNEALKIVNEAFLLPFTSIIFTSTNGVNIFMEELSTKGIHPNHLANKRLFAIGPKTAEAIKNHGLIPNAIPEKFVAEKVLDLFPHDLKNEKILIPTAAGARTVLSEGLKNRQAEVTVLPIYENISTKVQNIPIKDGDFVVFTSPSTAKNFFQGSLYNHQRILSFCIGEITRNEVEKYVVDNIFTSKESTSQSLIQCLLDTVGVKA